MVIPEADGFFIEWCNEPLLVVDLVSIVTQKPVARVQPEKPSPELIPERAERAKVLMMAKYSEDPRNGLEM
jgi:hypothetical protein